MIYHIISIGLAYIIDLIVGDPTNWPHPVKWFGRMIHSMDQRLNKNKHRKFKGLLMVIILTSLTFFVSIIFIYLIYQWHPLLGVVVEAILISTTLAQKGLRDAGLRVVYPLEKNDIPDARLKLSSIVGRDTAHLTKEGVIRGTVETIAENTSDGITVPLFWAFIGGAPLALVYKVVNTCDSMVGYKNEEYRSFGWASAKLDDMINFIPARLTAIVMINIMRPKKSTRKKAWSILLRDANKHASPNSGWGEAAVAALLGIQLGGRNRYQGKETFSIPMGDPLTNLQTVHILETITIMKRTVGLFFILFILVLVIINFYVPEISFLFYQ